MRFILFLICWLSFLSVTAQKVVPIPKVYTTPRLNELQRNDLINFGTPIPGEPGSTILYHELLLKEPNYSPYEKAGYCYYVIIEYQEEDKRFYGFVYSDKKFNTEHNEYDLIWGELVPKGGYAEYVYLYPPKDLRPFNGRLSGKYYFLPDGSIDGTIYEEQPNGGQTISYPCSFDVTFNFQPNKTGARLLDCKQMRLAPTRPGGGRRGGGRGIRKITRFTGGYNFQLFGHSQQSLVWNYKDNVLSFKKNGVPIASSSAKLVELPLKTDEYGQPIDRYTADYRRHFNQQCREDFGSNDDVYDAKKFMKIAMKEEDFGDTEYRYRVMGQTENGALLLFTGNQGEEDKYGKYDLLSKDKKLEGGLKYFHRVGYLNRLFNDNEKARRQAYVDEYKKFCVDFPTKYLADNPDFRRMASYTVLNINLDKDLAEIAVICDVSSTSRVDWALLDYKHWKILQNKRLEPFVQTYDTIVNNQNLLAQYEKHRKFKKLYKQYVAEFQQLLYKYEGIEVNVEDKKKKGGGGLLKLMDRTERALERVNGYMEGNFRSNGQTKSTSKSKSKDEEEQFILPNLYFKDVEDIPKVDAKAHEFISLQERYIQQLPQKK